MTGAGEAVSLPREEGRRRESGRARLRIRLASGSGERRRDSVLEVGWNVRPVASAPASHRSSFGRASSTRHRSEAGRLGRECRGWGLPMTDAESLGPNTTASSVSGGGLAGTTRGGVPGGHPAESTRTTSFCAGAGPTSALRTCGGAQNAAVIHPGWDWTTAASRGEGIAEESTRSARVRMARPAAGQGTDTESPTRPKRRQPGPPARRVRHRPTERWRGGTGGEKGGRGEGERGREVGGGEVGEGGGGGGGQAGGERVREWEEEGGGEGGFPVPKLSRERQSAEAIHYPWGGGGGGGGGGG